MLSLGYALEVLMQGEVSAVCSVGGRSVPGEVPAPLDLRVGKDGQILNAVKGVAYYERTLSGWSCLRSLPGTLLTCLGAGSKLGPREPRGHRV
jgi:hypothetical protein